MSIGHSGTGGTAGSFVVVVHTEPGLDHHVAVEILVSAVLIYLRCAGLGVTRLPLLRPELGLTVVTGCHVVRKTTHLPDPKPALARLGARAPVCVVPLSAAGFKGAGLLVEWSF